MHVYVEKHTENVNTVEKQPSPIVKVISVGTANAVIFIFQVMVRIIFLHTYL